LRMKFGNPVTTTGAFETWKNISLSENIFGGMLSSED
jgi:hypothetical protein